MYVKSSTRWSVFEKQLCQSKLHLRPVAVSATLCKVDSVAVNFRLSREVLLSDNVFKMSNTSNQRGACISRIVVSWHWHPSIHSVCWICRAFFMTNVIVQMPVCLLCCFWCSFMELWLKYLSFASIYKEHKSIVSQQVNLPLHEGGLTAGLCALHLTDSVSNQTASDQRFSHIQNISFIKLPRSWNQMICWWYLCTLSGRILVTSKDWISQIQP